MSAIWEEDVASHGKQSKAHDSVQELRNTIKVRNGDGFARGNVGEVKGACLLKGIKVAIVHSPGKSESHSSVKVLDFLEHDLEILEFLATESWNELILNSQVL